MKKRIKGILGMLMALSMMFVTSPITTYAAEDDIMPLVNEEFAGYTSSSTAKVHTFSVPTAGTYTVSVYTRYQSGERCDYFTLVVTDKKGGYISSKNGESDTGGVVLKVNLDPGEYNVVLWQVGGKSGTYAYSGLIY